MRQWDCLDLLRTYSSKITFEPTWIVRFFDCVFIFEVLVFEVFGLRFRGLCFRYYREKNPFKTGLFLADIFRMLLSGLQKTDQIFIVKFALNQSLLFSDRSVICVAFVQPPALRKKKSERNVMECAKNYLISYYPSTTISLKQRVLIGFYFYFSTSTQWEPPWEILRWVRVYFALGEKIRIKIVLMVKEVFLLKYERNCYLWSVKWRSILRTFVGIVVSAKETKAFLTNLH